MKKKLLASTLCAVGLLASASLASAGTSAVTYATDLPVFSNNIYLATGKKDDNSLSKVENSVVGSTYTANMWIVDANGKKVSATATKVTDNDTRQFTVDQKAVGDKVNLAAENDTVTYVKVEISGKFYPDTK
ncbi:hypothetical protein ACQKOF_24670 [Lysinibacillus sp. NPDC093190]|uniref:hypothetical protein n=1 Tax=Lysinibacillus sp. NPDC093190 TaxID=3390575 RepID=UPI003D02AA82